MTTIMYRIRWRRSQWEYGSNDFKSLGDAKEFIASHLSEVKNSTYQLTRVETKETEISLTDESMIRSEDRILTI